MWRSPSSSTPKDRSRVGKARKNQAFTGADDDDPSRCDPPAERTDDGDTTLHRTASRDAGDRPRDGTGRWPGSECPGAGAPHRAPRWPIHRCRRPQTDVVAGTARRPCRRRRVVACTDRRTVGRRSTADGAQGRPGARVEPATGARRRLPAAHVRGWLSPRRRRRLDRRTAIRADRRRGRPDRVERSRCGGGGAARSACMVERSCVCGPRRLRGTGPHHRSAHRVASPRTVAVVRRAAAPRPARRDRRRPRRPDHRSPVSRGPPPTPDAGPVPLGSPDGGAAGVLAHPGAARRGTRHRAVGGTPRAPCEHSRPVTRARSRRPAR